MSGSGGGSWDPSWVRTEIRELEGKVEDASYDIAVAETLSSLLANANDRDVEKINTHLSSIKSAIEKDVEGFVDLLFGGSVAKHTYVAGLSDVDALVVINESDLSGLSPLQVRDYFIVQLRERVGVEVVPDGFAVSVKYADGTVQLVPVRRQGENYLLPSDDCSSWSRTRPRVFAEALTAVNRENNGKVIPTIKLAKLALADTPDQRRPRGYHLEALAVEIFSGYGGSTAPKDMLMHFFAKASQRVLEPIPDRTGQSRHVDESLGEANSLERQILADSMGRIARRMQNAEGANSVEQWNRVFGGE